MDIDVVLENLLKEKNVYNEQEIEKRVIKWPDRSARRNAMYNIGLNKKIFDEHIIDIATIYCAFDGHFNNGINDIIKKTASFSKTDFTKLSNLSRFYYTQCKDPKLFSVIDPSFKLIVISSLIESLMSNNRFVEFNEWYFKEYADGIEEKSGKNFGDTLKDLWEKYKEKQGAYRKFKIFFKEYLPEEEQEKLLNGFKRLGNKDKDVDVDCIARWLYEMRSKFVHEADHVQLPESIPNEKVYLGHRIGKDSICITISIDQILSIFEKGFLRYFSLLL